MRASSRLLFAFLLVAAHLAWMPARAGHAQSSRTEPAGDVSSETTGIRLTFRNQVELKTLLQFVSVRLGMNIHFDDSIARKRVTILSPATVTRKSLLGLLESVLKMSGFALVDSEQPGWKKVVTAKNLLPRITDHTSQQGASRIVARIFALRHAKPAAISRTIKPFLSRAGGNSLDVPGQRMLIVTDFAENLREIARVIAAVDRPGPAVSVQLVSIAHVSAEALSRKVTELIRQRTTLAGVGTKAAVVVNFDARTNSLILITEGSPAVEILQLVRSLDTPTQAVTRKYSLKYSSPLRVEKLLKGLLDAPSRGEKAYRSAVDEESGLWIVHAPPHIHEQVASLIKQIDVPETDRGLRRMQFYKLRNTTAQEVLATIQALDGKGEVIRALAGADEQTPTGPVAARITARTKDAIVTADPNTNTIIVVAPPAIQQVYRQLIDMLDKRRPQVMIEVTLVTLDTSNGFSLGVEFSGTGAVGGGGGGNHLTFSAFGLSEVDADSGALTIRPGAGFNAVLLNPDCINVVIKALATSGRAKVLSAPKVLVNDNATASLSSVAEFPFASVNASDTVATTTFGGYASAGTTINVTPHISEDAYLQLKYQIELNSFSQETGGGDLPPPRQTSKLASEITIPNGHAIVVGGLKRMDESETASKVPGLGDLPLLGPLFSSRSNNDVKSTLFVFIRPVILRDDRFRDLQYLSEQDLRAAGLPPNFPPSSPMIMR